MQNILSFSNAEFSVEVILIDNEPHWVGSKVATILGFTNPRKALQDHVLTEDVTTGYPLETSGGVQKVNLINETGLYYLIFGSKLESAQKFKRWVTKEVLPQIRKTGSYNSQPALPDFSNPAEAARAWALEYEEKERLRLKIESDKDKVDFAENLLATTNAIDFKTASKAMHLPYGRNTLFANCRNLGILDKNNQPYQEYIDRGYFTILEYTYLHPKTGDHILATKTLITAKGQQFLLKKLT